MNTDNFHLLSLNISQYYQCNYYFYIITAILCNSYEHQVNITLIKTLHKY